MARAIREVVIIPFFRSGIPGYSIRDLTKPGFWFDEGEDSLGPWDWKIDCLQSSGIAYGKFLCGGKAAFATIPFYRELMNVRRATTQPDENGRKIMTPLEGQEVITIREVRELLGVKKSAADAAITKLQHQCRVVTGVIERVYRGPYHTYNGWQVASFCTPESLFNFDFASFPFQDSLIDSDAFSLHTNHTPEESLEFLKTHIAGLFSGAVSEKQIMGVLK